jgi:hypothetical protein
MDAVEPVLVAELRLDLVDRVRPLPEQRWLVQRAALNELVVLDHQLTPIWRLGLPAGRLGFVAVATTCRWWRCREAARLSFWMGPAGSWPALRVLAPRAASGCSPPTARTCGRFRPAGAARTP